MPIVRWKIACTPQIFGDIVMSKMSVQTVLFIFNPALYYWYIYFMKSPSKYFNISPSRRDYCFRFFFPLIALV